ncbi:plastocyanin/azurin family copper-binding protein [Roseobacter sp. SK209-2-6]|uniref:plastocyanin/azurin family copper-binding protein n=1 Tax=Roseobacter sp. SK209-2-6 TaxID=388739 RepID=UPI00031D482F|nr:plastocyanin/azurin family copper-binding protein [Roseobacter sp. SK209-2-6]
MSLKRTILGLALSLAPLLPAGQPVWAEVHEVDQVIDLAAMTPEEVYRFEPNYLWIEPGDSINFLNSTGNHTVTAIEGMWPEGADFVNIEHQPLAEVTFDVPGVYGFRCKVHGRHGMYALVVVGSPEANMERLELTKVSALGKRIFAGLIETMNEDWAKRTE